MFDKVKYQSDYYKPHAGFWNDRVSRYASEFNFVQRIQHLEKQRGNITKQELLFTIDTAGKQALDKIAKGNPAAIFTVILSSFALLIKRYGGNDTLIIDIPPMHDSDRQSANPLPLVLPIDEGVSYKEYLNTMSRLIRDTYLYQDFPIVLHDRPFVTNVLCCYDEMHGVNVSAETYDLVIRITEKDNSTLIKIAYNEQYFEAPYLSLFFERIILILSADLNLKLADIDILTAQEKEQIPYWGKGELVTYEGSRLIHQLFEQKASLFPFETAIIYCNKSLTYAELNQKSNSLALLLRQSYQVKSNDRIGIYMDKSDLMVIAIIAVLKSGAAYVPMDPNIPAERAAFILNDAGVNVLITESKYMFGIDYFPGALLAIDIQMDEISDAQLEDNYASADDPAYVIYTSGSTGQPKGVLIKHKNIFNTVSWRNKYYGFNVGTGILQIASVAFDSSVEDFFCAVTSGATLIIPEDEKKKDVHYLNGLILKHKVTHFLITPSFYDVLLDELDYRLVELKVVTVAGEAITENVVKKHFRLLDNVKLINEYGPTENAVCTTYFELGPQAPITIGKPIDNTRVYILDYLMRMLPFDTLGEIYIAGDGLCDQYINNELLNKTSFVEAEIDGKVERLYKTGDFGRWTAEGNIIFSGRKDNQVKINGYRIELGEVEAVIRKQSGVSDCRALFSGEQNKQIKAIIKPDSSSEYALFQLTHYMSRDPEFIRNLKFLQNGMAVRFKNKAETELLYKEIFEDQLYIRHKIMLHDNAVIFDVGANIGMFSIYAGLHTKGTQIYAFEPLAPIFDILKTNISLYNINVRAYNIGLSNVDGSADFIYYQNNTASSGRYADVKSEKTTGRTVIGNNTKYNSLTDDEVDQLLDESTRYERHVCKIQTLSTFIRQENIEVIDLLKLDVEKSELDVLMGIDANDWKKIRQIVAEVHDIAHNMRDIELLFDQYGFSYIKEQPDFLTNSEIYYYYASRPALVRDQPSVIPVSLQFNQEGLFTDAQLYLQFIKDKCSQALPSYMLPAAFALIPEFPLTTNGKADEKALLEWWDKVHMQKGDYEPPVSEKEILLAEIWSKVIGKTPIGIHDNFFQIGGDSIKAIQIASRMHNEGYKVEVKDLFEHLTIANLAAAIKSSEIVRDQSPVTGYIPLTPIQHELFPANKVAPHHFNQSMMLYSKERLEIDAIKAVFAKLQVHHDALRMTYRLDNQEWIQYNNGPDYPLSVNEYSLPGTEGIEALANELQQSIDLSKGPVMRIGLFHLPDGDRLLIIIHHMVIDGVSWRILLEDISILFDLYRQGKDLQLPLKTDSFKTWAEQLIVYAHSDAFLSESEYWSRYNLRKTDIIKSDWADQPVGHGILADFAANSFSLDEFNTSLLTGQVNIPFNTTINDILLTTLSLALKDTFDVDSIMITMEGHGREEIMDGIDITRTVGWFTTTYPVWLNITEPLSAHIIGVKENLRNIPGKGIGYGISKHILGAVEDEVQPSQILFNYLGQFDEDVERTAFTFANESSGQASGLADRCQHDLNIISVIANNEFSFTVEYNLTYFKAERIQAFIKNYESSLLTVIKFCCNYKDKEITPSDLSVKGISSESLDRIKSMFK